MNPERINLYDGWLDDLRKLESELYELKDLCVLLREESKEIFENARLLDRACQGDAQRLDVASSVVTTMVVGLGENVLKTAPVVVRQCDVVVSVAKKLLAHLSSRN
jgi:hypothetical protein